MLKHRYGITVADYEEMYAGQNGCCAMCNRTFERLCVDHNHETGKVRALLCVGCNRLLGIVESRPELLEAARDYREKHN